MTDILEYSNVAFPRERFSEELIDELVAVAPSVVEFDSGRVIVKHLYIERRMIPLNIYLERADDAQRMHAMREYGNAIKDLAAVNIFAGDLLFKNFGVTRFGRVVFYDYDEIDFLTDCNFRRIPEPPPGYDEMSSDVWYPVGPKDMFPEEFATFLLTDARTRACFMYHHADLLTPDWWQAMQREIRSGRLVEVLSYTDATRFGRHDPRRRRARGYRMTCHRWMAMRAVVIATRREASQCRSNRLAPTQPACAGASSRRWASRHWLAAMRPPARTPRKPRKTRSPASSQASASSSASTPARRAC